MFQKIKKYIKYVRQLQAEQNSTNGANNYTGDIFIIDKNLEINLANLRSVLGKSNDISFKEFKIGVKKQTKAFICIVDGLVDRNKVEQYVETLSMFDKCITDDEEKILDDDLFTIIKENLLYSVEVKEIKSFNYIIGNILSGCITLCIDGYDSVFIINVRATEDRAIEEPNTEMSVRGSREGFVENIGVNISLLRKIIKNHNLIIKSLTLGSQTHTKVGMVYMEGIANKSLVEEVERRLNKINLDVILESGYIEQSIEDHPFSFFSTIGNSEKPDKVAAKLLEGRVAILCNGTPFVLTVPYLFIEAFQSTGDYYSRPFLSSVMRIIRIGSFFITLLSPALYVALTTYNQEMIPTVLLVTFAGAREGVPFPAFVETAIMLIAFDLIKESGVTMPKPVGQAVSIVGALVVGQAAVQAGIVGAPILIVVAITGIAGFIVTPMMDAVTIFRLFILILSGIFGLFGFTIGTFIMIGHMCSLKSFGVPYLAPFAPTIWSGLKDSIIRLPLRFLKSKPQFILNGNLDNTSNNDKGSDK
jgi:spore germination protein KA